MTDDELFQQHMQNRPRREHFETAAEHDAAVANWYQKAVRVMKLAGYNPSMPWGGKSSTKDRWFG